MKCFWEHWVLVCVVCCNRLYTFYFFVLYFSWSWFLWILLWQCRTKILDLVLHILIILMFVILVYLMNILHQGSWNLTEKLRILLEMIRWKLVEVWDTLSFPIFIQQEHRLYQMVEGKKIVDELGKPLSNYFFFLFYRLCELWTLPWIYIAFTGMVMEDDMLL